MISFISSTIKRFIAAPLNQEEVASVVAAMHRPGSMYIIYPRYDREAWIRDLYQRLEPHGA